MDRESFKAALESAGYTEITTTTTPQERHNPEHAHEYDVRGMVLEGSLTLTWDGQTKTFRPGDTTRCLATAGIRRAWVSMEC